MVGENLTGGALPALEESGMQSEGSWLLSLEGRWETRNTSVMKTCWLSTLNSTLFWHTYFYKLLTWMSVFLPSHHWHLQPRFIEDTFLEREMVKVTRAALWNTFPWGPLLRTVLKENYSFACRAKTSRSPTFYLFWYFYTYIVTACCFENLWIFDCQFGVGVKHQVRN